MEVSDRAGGVTDGLIESCALRIRPTWIRDLHSPESPLLVAKLKAKDSPKPGKDKLSLSAVVNAGGVLLDDTADARVRLVDASNDATYLDIELPADAPGTVGVEGAKVKAKLSLNRAGSSRGALSVKVSGLDLPGPLPAALRVEVVIRDAVLVQEFATENGKPVGPPTSPFFVVEKLKSKAGASGVRATSVSGRFSPVAGDVTGGLEISVGAERVWLDESELRSKGAKRIVKNGRVVKKLVVDLAKGTFSAKLVSDHELDVDGVTPVSLRVGDAFYGDSTVLPAEKGTKSIY